MARVIHCPECEHELQVPPDLLGQKVQCPECKFTFVAEAPKERPSVRRVESDDDDDTPPPGRTSKEKPGKVQAIALMSLIGGIWAILWSLSFGAASGGFCCFWPGTYYSLVLGILAIVRASPLLGEQAYREKVPSNLAILHIINIVSGDVVNLVLGIIMMVFCSEKEVRDYFEK